MKKAGIILSLLLVSILALNLFNSVSAQTSSIDSNVKSIDDKVKQLEEVQKQLSAEETRNQYLQERALAYMQSTNFGRFLLSINDGLHKLSPAFKFLIGIEYSFSTLFFMTLLTWIVIWVYVHRTLYIFDILLMNKPSYAYITKQVLTLGILILLSLIGLTPAIALLLSTPYYLVLAVLMVVMTVMISVLIKRINPTDNPIRFEIQTGIALIVSAVITYILSRLDWLKSFIIWMATLPSWLNKIIAIFMFAFALYYSIAYSKLLKRYFTRMRKEKERQKLENRIEELEDKEDDKEETGGLTPEEKKEKRIAEQTLIAIGKELEKDISEGGEDWT